MAVIEFFKSHITEAMLPKESLSVPVEAVKSAGEVVLESLPKEIRDAVLEKVAAGLPMRDAIEVSRAQIAHDAANAVSPKETTAKAK